MLSSKIAFPGLFSRNDRQPARSRARTNVAVDLEVLEGRELQSRIHPGLGLAGYQKVESTLKNLNAEYSHGLSKTEYRVMNLKLHENASSIGSHGGSGPMFAAPQFPPPKAPMPLLGLPPATSTLPTISTNPVTTDPYITRSGPATTFIPTTVSSPPSQTSVPGSQPANGPVGAPTLSAPSTPGPAPIGFIAPGSVYILRH